MIFYIRRASGILEDSPPCKGARLTKIAIDNKDDLFSQLYEKWEIELNSLDELIDLSTSLGESLVIEKLNSHSIRNKKYFTIVIYDDYIE